MGAPAKGMKAVDDATAEALLSSFENIAAAERRKHATVFNYWLSIRGDRHFPPIRDLDPLEISDAGPSSVLLELIGSGEDADIRHLGQSIKAGVKVERISEAPRPSLLSCIAKQLPLVASSRQALAFEDFFSADGGSTRCWVTLLPFSSTGTYVDYVYGLVTLEEVSKPVAPELVEESVEQAPERVEEALEDAPQAASAEVEDVPSEPADGPADIVPDVIEEPIEAAPEAAEVPVADLPNEVEQAVEAAPETEVAAQEAAPFEDESPSPEEKRPGFSKLLDTIASVGGFYGNVVQMEPKLPSAPVEDIEEPNLAPEGTMQSKLADVRAKADEARMAKLRSNLALYEGLSAAYDFALDAEENAEDYLKLVEAQGLKIQLRAPMAPVVKLAFDGMCDEATIAQLEKVLAWALKNDLPKGSLAERIEAEGGLAPILNDRPAAA